MDRHGSNVDAHLIAHARRAGRDSLACRHLHDDVEELCRGYLITLVDRDTIFAELRRAGHAVPLPCPPSFSVFYEEIVLVSARRAAEEFIEEQIFGGKWERHQGSLYATALMLGLNAFAVVYTGFRAERRERREPYPL
jgi:hypothetical protein